MRLATIMLLALATFATANASAQMRTIPAGRYRPLYAVAGHEWIHVNSFALDQRPVSRADFLGFVQSHPSWRRSAIKPLFADGDYLNDWADDENPGVLVAGTDAVTSVSWFAARAYCSAQGKRLPTVDEWEYAASASETAADATRSAGFRQRLLNLYARIGSRERREGFRNVHGIEGLHGVEWEWTEDFNSVVVPDDSRQVGSATGNRDHTLFCASAAIGASDPSDYPAFLRYGFRAALTGRSTARTLGFRCASSAGH